MSLLTGEVLKAPETSLKPSGYLRLSSLRWDLLTDL